MAKLTSKLQFDGTYTHGVRKELNPNLNVVENEVIIPNFESLPLDDYERCEKFPTVPFRMIIIGSSGSGKSSMIKKIAEQDKETYCQRDFFIWYGNNSPYPDNIKEFPYHEPNGQQHMVVAYDDPEPKYFPLIANVFRLGRPKGISPILVVHSWEQIANNPHLKVLVNQANIICLCQESATDIRERHHRQFDAFLKCPNSMRKQILINSLNGMHDYNWIINGKECRNFYIDYPNTLYEFKKYKIDPLLPTSQLPLPPKSVALDNDSSDTSGEDDGVYESSSTSSDEEDVQLPVSKYHKSMAGKYKPEPILDARGTFNRIQDLQERRQAVCDLRVKKWQDRFIKRGTNI